MINLDAYINNTIEVVLGKKTYQVKEPSVGIYFKMDEIEKDLNKENYHEKRMEVALLLINNNVQNEKVSKEQLLQVPIEGIEALVREISTLRLQAENDPN